MIIVKLTGGLGNQMFQYAAGFALAQKRRTVLKLDISWFKEGHGEESHNRYGLSAFNISEQFASEDECAIAQGRTLSRTEAVAGFLAERLRFRHYASRYSTVGRRYRTPSFRYDPEFHEQPDGTYLEGYFQSEQFFHHCSRLLRLHFTNRYPLSQAAADLGKRIRDCPNPVCVHVRLGDYTKTTEFGVLGRSYYKDAIKDMIGRFPDAEFFVFSDDIVQAETLFDQGTTTHFVRTIQPEFPFEVIALMAMCPHAIIANSTLSWWGAWLRAEGTGVAIAPSPWYASKLYDTRDVVPAQWKPLPAGFVPVSPSTASHG